MGTRERKAAGGRPYKRNAAAVLATSDVCGICGHGGARTADHVIPWKRWPRDERGKLMPGFDDVTNLQPAHGTAGNRITGSDNPCRHPDCLRLWPKGRRCNQSKNDRQLTGNPRSRDW